jgi:archaellum biogenesis protein FlaJ (TadC family)
LIPRLDDGLFAKNLAKGLIVVAFLTLTYLIVWYVGIGYPLNIIIFLITSFVTTLFVFAYGIIKAKYLTVTTPDIDFIFMLAHAYAVSTSGTSNLNIVSSVSDAVSYPKIAKYMKKVVNLSRNFGYDLARSLYIVSSEVSKLKYLRDFMERYAASIRVGESAERFIEVELRNYMNVYEYSYQRIMDSVNVLLSTYTAVLTSAIFVVANLLVLSIMFGGDLSIVLISLIGVFTATAVILIPIWMVSPRDILVVSGSLRRDVLKTPNIVFLLSCVACLVIVLLRLIGFINLSLYVTLALLGVVFLVPGYMYVRVEKFVKEVDKDLTVFVRMYGGNLSIVPSPLKALEPLLSVLFGKVANALRRLHTLLSSQISFSVSLKEFVLYTRSELAHRISRILEDTLRFGGDSSKAGLSLSEISLMIGRLRLRRYQIHKTFETSTYAIYLTNVLLITFITSLMRIFASVLSQIQTIMPFYPLSEPFINAINLFVIMSITLMNTVALTITNGGLKRTATYYLAILLVLGGLGGIISDVLVVNLLQPVAEIILQPVIPLA